MFDRDCKECDVIWIVCALFDDTQLGIDLFQSWISLDARLIDQAGLAHRTAHGLREAGATIAATNGATAHRAILGWGLLKQVEIYTREADQSVSRKRRCICLMKSGTKPAQTRSCAAGTYGGKVQSN
jgi:hypothetical protein